MITTWYRYRRGRSDTYRANIQRLLGEFAYLHGRVGANLGPSIYTYLPDGSQPENAGMVKVNMAGVDAEFAGSPAAVQAYLSRMVPAWHQGQAEQAHAAAAAAAGGSPTVLDGNPGAGVDYASPAPPVLGTTSSAAPKETYGASISGKPSRRAILAAGGSVVLAAVLVGVLR